MDNPNVLIVGAGALGITTGYHLHLSGAGITFLVRSGKLESLHPPLVLYCYDDAQLKQFNDYATMSSVEEISGQNFDYVLVTLDGSSCRSEEGTQLIRALGNQLRNTSALIMFNGVGAIDYCKEIIQIADDRIMEGTMAILSYQTDRVTLPVNSPTDPEQLAKSSIAYRHGTKQLGFMVADKPDQAARDFAALYSLSGVSRCNVVNQTIYRMFTASFFPTMAIFDIAGWPDAKTMAGERELMKLCCKAMKEIVRLPEYGWRGKLAGLLLAPKLLAWQNIKMERDCLPVDYSAFNKFHHGGKVRDQDLGSMKQSLASGNSQGIKMPALAELVRRYEKHLNQ